MRWLAVNTLLIFLLLIRFYSLLSFLFRPGIQRFSIALTSASVTHSRAPHSQPSPQKRFLPLNKRLVLRGNLRVLLSHKATLLTKKTMVQKQWYRICAVRYTGYRFKTSMTGQMSMTELLQRAISAIAQLSPEEQDTIAARLLEELEDEQQWQESFQNTTESQWSQMAATARQEIAAGNFVPTDEVFPVEK